MLIRSEKCREYLLLLEKLYQGNTLKGVPIEKLEFFGFDGAFYKPINSRKVHKATATRNLSIYKPLMTWFMSERLVQNPSYYKVTYIQKPIKEIQIGFSDVTNTTVIIKSPYKESEVKPITEATIKNLPALRKWLGMFKSYVATCNSIYTLPFLLDNAEGHSNEVFAQLRLYQWKLNLGSIQDLVSPVVRIEPLYKINNLFFFGNTDGKLGIAFKDAMLCTNVDCNNTILIKKITSSSLELKDNKLYVGGVDIDAYQ